MPVNKSAFIRYRIIDACLTNNMRRYPGIAQLREKIESQLGQPISVSMLGKDISQMKSIFGAPIVFNRQHSGYCYTQEGFSIKEFPLTLDEIQALDYSTALLQQLKGTRMFKHFENAINKVIEGYRLSGILGKSETQILQVEEPVRTDSGLWLENILTAIVEKKILRICYQGFGKEASVHVFSPYLLKEYRNRWYVIGFSEEKSAVIVMALDRIQEILKTSGRYRNPETFSPDQFFKYSLGITQVHAAEPEILRIAFSATQAPYILSQPLHHSQKIISETDNSLLIELHLYISPELKMTLLSFGPEAEVISPATLRNDIKNSIEKMKHLYKK